MTEFFAAELATGAIGSIVRFDETGTILDQFDCPDDQIRGLTMVDGDLFCFSSHGAAAFDYYLYRLNVDTGAVLDSMVVVREYDEDLAYDGTYVLGSNGSVVDRLDPATGTLVDANWLTSHGDPDGIAVAEGSLWIARTSGAEKSITEYDLTGAATGFSFLTGRFIDSLDGDATGLYGLETGGAKIYPFAYDGTPGTTLTPPTPPNGYSWASLCLYKTATTVVSPRLRINQRVV